jgi:hypothetical protein
MNLLGFLDFIGIETRIGQSCRKTILVNHAVCVNQAVCFREKFF